MAKSPPAPPPIQARHLKQASLSFSQESLWFLQQLEPGSNVYNSTVLLKFTGGIDPAALHQALNALILRHESLRTLYPSQGGRPVQVVQPFEPFALPFVDYSAIPEDEMDQAVQKFVAAQSEQPFDLHRGPSARFAHLHTAQNVDYLYFCTHHINFDAWSRQIFISELLKLYEAFLSGKDPALSELPIQFADFAEWQKEWLREEWLAVYVEHWKEIVSGDLPVLEIQTDRPRPVIQTFRGARVHFQLPKEISGQMKEFCRAERMTVFQLLLAAYALMLMRHSGQEDIIVGCPFANRSRPELDGLIGLFVNTLPIRVNLEGNPGVREYLKRVQGVMLEAYPWQAAPFEALVSDISPQRDLSRNPVFQVVINLKNVPKRQALLEGLEVESLQPEVAPSPFDLSLEFEVGEVGALEASLQYNVDLFDDGTIQHMATHYQNLLRELITKGDRPIADLEMLTPSERDQTVLAWNDTGMDFPQVCIHDLFTEQVEKNPAALAVVCNGKSLSYGDLERKANQLAHYLWANGVRAEDRVGIYLQRSEQIVIATLGILKAGAAYVPLDLTYPTERIAYMAKDSDPFAIITLSNLTDQLPNQIRKICLDGEADFIDACESGRLAFTTSNEALAYLIYTSGSTGRPKGSLNAHKGVVNYLTCMTKQFHFEASERVVQFTSLAFDPSVGDILGTLTYGGTVFLLDDAQMRDPGFIYTAIINHQATHITVIPTMLRAICESAPAGERKKNWLRSIAVGGEILHEADVKLARRVFGEEVELVNRYGPTECSIWTTHYVVPAVLPGDLPSVPIGKPIRNSRVYVLDNYFHPVPAGAKGELFIGGMGVGRGYWNKPDLTAERFLSDPFQPGGRMYRSGDIVRQLPDGTICFLGRSDAQVKLRGYRVELSEIEAVMSEFLGVREAAVVLWREDGSENLAAYITVLEGQTEQIQGNLQAYLAKRLPFFMLPASITVLDEMPLTPSSKIDRRALPRPQSGLVTDKYLAPRDDIETRLVRIWQEILGVERVGIRDNFFELGGHSLLAVQLFSRIKEDFGQNLPLMLLFQVGTVEAIAEKLRGQKKPTLPQGVIPIQPEGSDLPLFIVSAGLYYRELVLALSPGRPVYGLEPIENGEKILRPSVQETARIYYQNLVNFYPKGPYLLLGHSAHGFFTLELARLLNENGKEVAFLGLLDSLPPGPPRQANLIDRVKIHIINLRGKNLVEILQYFHGSILRFLARWRSKREMKPSIIERFEKEGRAGDIRRLVLGTYKPEPFKGKVFLFSATQPQPPWYIRWDPMDPWRKYLIGQVDIVPIPGDHMSAFEPPHVAMLAQKIEELLPQIDRE
jgi:amino acid adenylation domain-containing protein